MRIPKALDMENMDDAGILGHQKWDRTRSVAGDSCGGQPDRNCFGKNSLTHATRGALFPEKHKISTSREITAEDVCFPTISDHHLLNQGFFKL